MRYRSPHRNPWILLEGCRDSFGPRSYYMQLLWIRQQPTSFCSSEGLKPPDCGPTPYFTMPSSLEGISRTRLLEESLSKSYVVGSATNNCVSSTMNYSANYSSIQCSAVLDLRTFKNLEGYFEQRQAPLNLAKLLL
jgi:hypothetical protein